MSARRAGLGRTIVARIVAAALTLWAVTVVVFLAMYLVPGDPLSVLLRGRKPTPELVEVLRAQYHLDDPLPVRYWSWFTGLLHGDWGYSIQFQQPVNDLVLSRLSTTALLVGYTAVLVVVLGSILGYLAAKRGGVVDRSVVIGSAVLSAVPAFVAALVLMLVFAGNLGWFPTFGDGGPGLGDRLYHLTLPAVALALSYIGLLARVTRASLKEQLVADHVTAARLRGIAPSRIMRRHVVRNGTVPILTYAGVLLAGLLVASQLVETAFGLNGIGGLVVAAVRNLDLAVVQATSILIVAVFIVTNLCVDLVAPALDVRLRETRKAKA